MKKILSFILTLVIVLSAFSLLACGERDKDSGELSGSIVLNDFETTLKLGQIRVIDRFGAVNKNDDVSFVRSGGSSAKLQPMGSYASGTRPYFYIPTVSKLFEYDYSDFSKVECVIFSMYNAQDADKSVVFGAVTKITGMQSVNRYSLKTFVLKQGWNDISFVVDHEYNKAMVGTETFEGLYYEFDNCGSREVADAPVFYLDDLILTFGKAEPDPNIGGELLLDENEICDFEKIYQKHIMQFTSPTVAVAPEISVISASSVGLIAPSGKNIFKVVSKPMNRDDWPGIRVPQSLMQASNFGKIPAAERANYELCFDIYAEHVNHSFLAAIYSADTPSVSSGLISVYAVKGQWVTWRKPLAGMPEELFLNPGSIHITWTELSIKTNIVFYFDNFRLEKTN